MSHPGGRSGTADLPLHYGRVPRWLYERMEKLAGAIVDAMAIEYGPTELLRRLSDPFWFQSFGCVLGMDWHSSGMTTSVLGALKRALVPRSRDLGLFVCGGRGRHSRKTPAELQTVGERTGLDGDELGNTSRLVAKVDNNAVGDGHNLYLHSFVVAADGNWVVIQQGMCPAQRTARRYHWRSDGVDDFVEEPHAGIIGPKKGTIMNLTDRRARKARKTICEMACETPAGVVEDARKLRSLILPHQHEVRLTDVFLKRLHATMSVARQRAPTALDELLTVPGLGPRTLEALALVSEVVYGRPSRFADPARFAFAHGGKDGHPHPVSTRVYDGTISTLRRALSEARLGRSDKIHAFKRLERQVGEAERWARGPDLSEITARGWRQAPVMGGRTCFDRTARTSSKQRKTKELQTQFEEKHFENPACPKTDFRKNQSPMTSTAEIGSRNTDISKTVSLKIGFSKSASAKAGARKSDSRKSSLRKSKSRKPDAAQLTLPGISLCKPPLN